MGLGDNERKTGPSRVSTPFTDAELEAIDAWGFAQRMRNRSDVIRTLVQRGLDAQTSGADAPR